MRTLRTNTARLLLLSALALPSVLSAACGRDREFGSSDVDTALLTRAGGDVLLAGGGRLPYEITSDRYKQWEEARSALRAQKISLTMRLDPMRVSESDIERVVRFFDRNRAARRAIEGTGLSVRDYVLTTIALEQQMAVASRRPRPTTPRPAPPPADSVAAQLARDSARVRVDTVPIVDTVIVPVDPRPSPTPNPSPTPAPPPPDADSATAREPQRSH